MKKHAHKLLINYHLITIKSIYINYYTNNKLLAEQYWKFLNIVAKFHKSSQKHFHTPAQEIIQFHKIKQKHTKFLKLLQNTQKKL